ncbi:MAG: hypothetical protein IBX45_11005 [Campylobacterales bacterium]|nr:hypothetical protein [Campylobacterales bacterium]
MRRVCACLLLGASAWASDYDFDMSAIEVKPYTLSGYLKGEAKHQLLNPQSSAYLAKDKESMQTYLGEANVKFAYFKEAWKFESEGMANYSDIDGTVERGFTLAQLYGQYKFDTNHLIEVGKKTPKWGKGYFVNPIAFFDRKKNPDDPEASREGYILANYRYNKSYSGDVQNITFDLLGLKKERGLNEEFEGSEGTYLGAKLYMLYRDTDIEFLYMYASDDHDKIGFDFSKNLQSNIEIHGEFAKTLGVDDYAYLVGFKYLTAQELSITGEYFYQKNKTSPKTPFWDKQYLITKFTQKEPFGLLYSSVYYKNSYNLEDHSMQNVFGATYSFKNNTNLDISYTTNSGNKGTEYGGKLVEDMLWTKVSWYF